MDAVRKNSSKVLFDPLENKNITNSFLYYIFSRSVAVVGADKLKRMTISTSERCAPCPMVRGRVPQTHPLAGRGPSYVVGWHATQHVSYRFPVFPIFSLKKFPNFPMCNATKNEFPRSSPPNQAMHKQEFVGSRHLSEKRCHLQ